MKLRPDELSKWYVLPRVTWIQAFNYRELWSYRGLMAEWIRKEFLIRYQQTLLGPVWVVMQPLITMVVYAFVFDKVIKVPLDNAPPYLFYLSGIILWNLFSDSLISTSFTIKENRALFQKVYFPRLIIPIAVASTQLLRFFIQLGLLFIIGIYYVVVEDFTGLVTAFIILIPVAIILSCFAGFAAGLIFAIITAKYRDLSNLIQLSTRLLMFVSPVFYPVRAVPESYRWFIELNPLTSLFELFRCWLIEPAVLPIQYLYSVIAILAFFAVGCIWYNKRINHLIEIA